MIELRLLLDQFENLFTKVKLRLKNLVFKKK